MITLILAILTCLFGYIYVIRPIDKLKWVDTVSVYLFYATLCSILWEVSRWSQNIQ